MLPVSFAKYGMALSLQRANSNPLSKGYLPQTVFWQRNGHWLNKVVGFTRHQKVTHCNTDITILLWIETKNYEISLQRFHKTKWKSAVKPIFNISYHTSTAGKGRKDTTQRDALLKLKIITKVHWLLTPVLNKFQKVVSWPVLLSFSRLLPTYQKDHEIPSVKL